MKQYTDEERKEALEDLCLKTKTMMQRCVDDIENCIRKLDESGCGIIEDHLQNQQNYKTPKDLILAITKQLEYDYRLVKHTRADKRRIENYFNLM